MALQGLDIGNYFLKNKWGVSVVGNQNKVKHPFFCMALKFDRHFIYVYVIQSHLKEMYFINCKYL